MAADSAVTPLLSMRSGEAPLERRKATVSSAASNAAYISAVDPFVLLGWRKGVFIKCNHQIECHKSRTKKQTVRENLFIGHYNDV